MENGSAALHIRLGRRCFPSMVSATDDPRRPHNAARRRLDVDLCIIGADPQASAWPASSPTPRSGSRSWRAVAYRELTSTGWGRATAWDTHTTHWTGPGQGDRRVVAPLGRV